ncbi:hypothetical protein ABK040_014633 [Willaertia magna]
MSQQQNNNSSSSTSSSPLNTPSSSSSFNKDEIEKQIEEWKNKYLNKYNCPISQQLMIDPVTIETGQTYDRNSIEEWLKSKNTCPITRATLKTKSLARNVILKDTIDEKVNKFIKKVIKHIKMWSTENNLIDLCLELINESLDLIKSDDSFKNCKNELIELKFNILLNELNEDKLFNNYMKAINESQDLQFKLIKLKLLENKLISDKYLQKYYNELLNLLIQLKNKENDNLLIEIFTKYCKLNNLNNNLIDKIFNEINEFKLDILIILFNESNYNRNNLLQKLLNIKINENNNKFVTFFKNLFKEINLNETDLNKLLEFILDYKNDLQNELIIIYKELYKNSNEIKYLEIIYELNNENKEIETLLMNEYLKLNFMDKYFNLFIKTNENKLDSFNLMLLKCLQNQNSKIENQNKEIINLQQLNKNQNNKIENQNKEIINLKNTSTDQNNEIINLQKLLTNQNNKIDEQNNKIIKLQQTIEDLNNSKNILQKQNNNLKLSNSKELQIINNFKNKYPEYDYVNIINIETPLNIKKWERFFSDEFKVFGLKWEIQFNPKGNSKSKENECGIFLHLISLQYKNENEEEKEISSIKIKYLIDSINLNDNGNFEYNFTEIIGHGSWAFKQLNFIPIIKNDKQIFSIVIGMKKLEIEFK